VNARLLTALFIIAAALFLLGGALVMNNPLPLFLDKFQTLLAGVLAIAAAGIAYGGAVNAARIQSKAILDQANTQAATQRARDEAERGLARVNFKMAVYLAAHHLRNDLLAKKGIMTEMIKTQGAVTRDSLHTLRVSVNSILLSGWQDLALLEPASMEQIIALQNFVAGINDAVTRLEFQQSPILPTELLEDLDEHYAGAITFISRFTPMRADNTQATSTD
jgi:hypothetical protein